MWTSIRRATTPKNLNVYIPGKGLQAVDCIRATGQCRYDLNLRPLHRPARFCKVPWSSGNTLPWQRRGSGRSYQTTERKLRAARAPTCDDSAARIASRTDRLSEQAFDTIGQLADGFTPAKPERPEH
ncbi:hypothetical protein Trydic_g11112 [Trypoxylus dichotomus]